MATITRGTAGPAANLARDPDILDARELAARLGIKDDKIIRDLADAGELPGMPAGSHWLFSWTAVYAWLAGPGIPFGEILDARGLAARLGGGVTAQLVRRTAGDPGTPRRFPGRKVGGQWRFALEASRAAIATRSQPEPSGDSVVSGT